MKGTGNMERLINEWRDNAEHIRKWSPPQVRGEAEVWDRCADQLAELALANLT